MVQHSDHLLAWLTLNWFVDTRQAKSLTSIVEDWPLAGGKVLHNFAVQFNKVQRKAYGERKDRSIRRDRPLKDSSKTGGWNEDDLDGAYELYGTVEARAN